MFKKGLNFFKDKTKHLSLPDNATIVTVGGGPAGAFFAIQAARKARALGKKINLIIIEKKRELCFYKSIFFSDLTRGCNYCAGVISPKLMDILQDNGLSIPEEIVTGKTEFLTVHGEWKSIELPVPKGRKMHSVFRGSRPKSRSFGHMNFDSYLLNKATEEGARIINGEVLDVSYTSRGKPIVVYRSNIKGTSKTDTMESDFVVVAAGVNQFPGMALESNDLFQALKAKVTGFHLPKIRKALICEMQTEEELLRYMRGEVHFAQYGAKNLKIEMSSLIPKGRWVTIVLIGLSIDRATPSQNPQILKDFLELPHIRRFFPRAATFTPVCICNPNMVIGVSRHAYDHRIALVGDMVVSRLYKDGIFSAYTTAAALADCIFNIGIDRTSLKKGYWPVVKKLGIDNKFGSTVFLLNRLTFSYRFTGRIFYQAVLSERKTKPEDKRRLDSILWRIASGDDTYWRILISMFSPATIWSIFSVGFLVTIRNVLIEKILGLKWTDFGRYPTGVPQEDVENKRMEFVEALNIQPFECLPRFERLYSIKINAEAGEILQQLGKFGDNDRQYLKVRMVKIYYSAGRGNKVGSVICYEFPLRFLSFSVILEKIVGNKYILYRVRDGIAKGGILVFHIYEKEKGLCVLSIYVAFDIPIKGNPVKKVCLYIFRWCFPAFVHDVVWNHSLCKLKHLVEMT
jgi:flavin-dependent dehydrogenase